MFALCLCPAAKFSIDRHHLDARKFRGIPPSHRLAARAIVITRNNLLSLLRVEELQIRLGQRLGAPPVHHAVHHRHARLGQNRDRREYDFKRIGAEFPPSQIRFVFPRDCHIADSPLDESRSRSPCPAVEHRHIAQQRRHKSLCPLVPTLRAPAVGPGREIIPAGSTRGFGVRGDDRDAWLDQIIPVPNALRIPLPHQEHNRARVGGRVVRQPRLPVARQ